MIYLCISRSLIFAELGANPDNTGRVWGGTLVLPTPDPILILEDHGGEG